MVIMTLFGGPGPVLGPVIGALILSAVSEVLSSQVSNVASLFYGLVIVLAVIFMPRGLIDLVAGIRGQSLRYFAANMRREPAWGQTTFRALDLPNASPARPGLSR